MSSVDLYQKALHEFASAFNAVNELAELISRIHASFEGWKNVDPSQLNGTLDRGIRDWPSAAHVSEVVGEWKKSWANLMAAWNAIDDRSRFGLKSPKEMTWDK